MSSIFYEARHGEVNEIDEISQRILVYTYLHGKSSPAKLLGPVGAPNKYAIQTRIEDQLGADAAGLVETRTSTQQTFNDTTNNPNTVLHSVVLTDVGESFIEKHRTELSMPVDIAELAKRVAALQIDEHVVEDLIHRVDVLESRVEELQE